MRWLASVLAITLVVALVWRSCAGNADDDRGQSEPTQAAWRDAPQSPGSSQASGAPVTAPELRDRHAAPRFNDGPRAPGETEKQYRARMEVLTGLEAFRQRAGIGDERYREILVAIYDHQYNWAKFMDAYPYEDDAPVSEVEPLVLDISGILQDRIMGPMTIKERMIWYETCRRCMLRIMFGADMVRLEEGER